MFKRILVPLDGSRFGSRALRYATAIAQHFDAEVILIRVIRHTTPMIAAEAHGVASPAESEIAVQAALEADKQNVARAKRYLRDKVRAIKSRHIKASYQVTIGEPAQSIMQFSKKENISLIVMTTHGKSGVIRESGKPVLVIRPQTSRKK